MRERQKIRHRGKVKARVLKGKRDLLRIESRRREKKEIIILRMEKEEKNFKEVKEKYTYKRN